MAPYNQTKIGQIVFDNENFLRTLARTKSSRKRQRLLRSATTQQLLSIVEICLNIIIARFRLTTRQKKRLMPYAHFVRKIARLETERGAKKILNQHGNGIPFGFFAALLTPILIGLKNAIKN